MKALHAAPRKSVDGSGPPPISLSWVYLPGNHDYKVWDMLATRVVCENVLLAGKPMGCIPTPLRAYTWRGEESFFAGLFREFGATDQVAVTYPNHVLTFGAQDTMVFTHGHYLDSKQTWWNDLTDEVHRAGVDGADKTIRRIIIETAQYQTMANAVSFTRRTRRFVTDVVGPDSLMNKIGRVLTRVGAWLIRLLFSTEGTRGQALSPKQLRNIETYVDHLCDAAVSRPRWFVFGHTHRQDSGRTPTHGIEVHNVGSFYPDGDTLLTFLEIEVRSGDRVAVIPMCIDGTMSVRRTEKHGNSTASS